MYHDEKRIKTDRNSRPCKKILRTSKWLACLIFNYANFHCNHISRQLCCKNTCPIVMFFHAQTQIYCPSRHYWHFFSLRMRNRIYINITNLLVYIFICTVYAEIISIFHSCHLTIHKTKKMQIHMLRKSIEINGQSESWLFVPTLKNGGCV